MKNNTLNQLQSALHYLRNKAPSIALMVVGFVVYRLLPDGLPFLEMFYTGLTIFATIVAAPFIRLLVFNEAAQYAESGGLTSDLQRSAFTPALLHYWFATAICYATALACLATITK